MSETGGPRSSPIPSRQREGLAAPAAGVGPTRGSGWRQRNTQRARDLRNNATPAERALWLQLRSRGLGGYKFTRQRELEGPVYGDFVCRSHKLVVELDGESHDFTGEADERRTASLERLGYRVIRFTNKDVFENMEGVLAVIAQELSTRPTPPLRGFPSRWREGS